MTIEDFLRMLLRNALLLIAVTVLGAAAGYGYSYTQPSLYSASAPGYVANGNVIPTEKTGSEEGHAIANDAVEAVAIETGGDEGVTAGYSLVTYQTALLPTAPVSPDRQRFAMLGAAAGLLLALALVFLCDRNDTRVRTAGDLPDGLELPVLGTPPEDKELARVGQPTLLIDADLRRPVVASEFGVYGEVGLSQLLAGTADPEEDGGRRRRAADPQEPR
ncbi:protein-tyrosine kinase [Brachybacterium squillarum]|uniref:protein-tyrosine kinase n=1 Tax=Brachybacterium squillarum TaxID=661979 RepID=UPI000262960C|nr:protein-tyrosine kinase [Brachybacterium squillarum]